MKEDLQWRIGDGNSIRVWTKPWLKNSENHYVASTSNNKNLDQRVGDLIDHDLRAWKINEVAANFNPNDAQQIQSIPVLNTKVSDKLIWKFTTIGDYSVCTAYHNIIENMLDNSNLKFQGNWMLLWKLQTPRNIKHFLWRLFRGCLPTKSNLRNKHVLCPIVCVSCEANIENE